MRTYNQSNFEDIFVRAGRKNKTWQIRKRERMRKMRKNGEERPMRKMRKMRKTTDENMENLLLAADRAILGFSQSISRMEGVAWLLMCNGIQTATAVWLKTQE